MLTLYDFGNSVLLPKVRIAMRSKGLTWESVKVDLFKAEQYDSKCLKLNPKDIVATLVHDGKPIIESTLLCEPFQSRALCLLIPWQRAGMRRGRREWRGQTSAELPRRDDDAAKVDAIERLRNVG